MKQKLQILWTALLLMVSVAILFLFDYWLFDMGAFFKGEWQELWFNALGFVVFIAGLFYTALCIAIIVEESKKVQ